MAGHGTAIADLGVCAPKIQKPRRQTYSISFKLQVVREAMMRPASRRIKPTCRDYPQVEPVC